VRAAKYLSNGCGTAHLPDRTKVSSSSLMMGSHLVDQSSARY
jgi:hypothetical protein